MLWAAAEEVVQIYPLAILFNQRRLKELSEVLYLNYFCCFQIEVNLIFVLLH